MYCKKPNICSIKILQFDKIGLFMHLNHRSLETPKKGISKEWRPKSDAAECGIWSGSPLFANPSAIYL